VREKVKTRSALATLAEQAKRDGKKIVFTNGCFDLLHVGHVRLLSAAKELGDILIVALNNDSSVRQIKGSDRPILPETERAELIAALEMVDYVTLFEEPDPLNVIRELRPDVLAKGGDWAEDQIVGREFVESYGGKVAVIPYLKDHSTTEIIERMRKQ
jgi:D-beta-D-heptose 7-phosphate kinase/D-beta-D-heptose 1-phosphate adenosyltransferase